MDNSEEFELPGAPKLTELLKENVEKLGFKIRSEEPIVEYHIFSDDEEIGVYTRYDGSRYDGLLRYEGIIPGVRNELGSEKLYLAFHKNKRVDGNLDIKFP